MQFDCVNFQQSPETLQFQRSQFKSQNTPRGIACEISKAGLERCAGTRPDNEPTHLHEQHRTHRRCGGHRRVRRAWLRCPWAAAGPGPCAQAHKHRRCEGRRRTAGLAAVPVGGGRAWPGFEPTRRAKLAARTTRGRAAAHGHTKQPGTTSNAARGRAAAHGHTKQPAPHTAKPPGPAGAGRLTQYQRIIEESRQYRDYRDHFPGAHSRCRASTRCPWRYLPSGDPRRRR